MIFKNNNNCIYIKRKYINNYFILIIIIQFLILTNISMKFKYNHYKFIIIKKKYSINGLFGFYVSYLGCINIYNKKGYIPILDLSSFPNIFNRFNTNSVNENPWELFFNQPYGYKLKNIKKYAKYIKYINCYPKERPDTSNIFRNNSILKFWHNIALKFTPIKNEIINEANRIKKYMFKGSSNILGILLRGTDYITRKPKYHPVQPNPEIVIKDTKLFDEQYNYDYIFITTEDDILYKCIISLINIKCIFINNINFYYY